MIYVYREVCCKTLIGKGKLDKHKEISIEVGTNASKTLGCWIINHQCNAYYHNKDIRIKGSYDVELWMAVDDDKLYLKTIITHYPSCVGMTLLDTGLVKVEIESQYVVDAFAEAILVVMCSDKNEPDLTTEEEIVMNVNPNYLINK